MFWASCALVLLYLGALFWATKNHIPEYYEHPCLHLNHDLLVRKSIVPIAASVHTEIEASYPSTRSLLRLLLPEEMTLIFDISPNYGAELRTNPLSSHFKATIFTVAICNPHTHSIRSLEQYSDRLLHTNKFRVWKGTLAPTNWTDI